MICVDTNILVFSTVSAAPQHTAATVAIDKARTTSELVVTAQVIREYIAATMLANGVTRILTDNVADFRRYAPEVEIVGLA